MSLNTISKGKIKSFQSRSLTSEKNKARSVGDGVAITYENTKQGMRQNFEVHEKPAGTEMLKLSIDVSSTLAFNVNADGKGVSFVGEDGDLKYRYDDLYVTDATGRELSAGMQKANGNLEIVVNDFDATYPILVDPISTTHDWSLESGIANTKFGYSVSTAGDVNADGYSDVIVGAAEFDNGSNTEEGRVYIYLGSASGLSTTAIWNTGSSKSGSRFGCSVSNAGDVNGDGYSDVIVGAYGYSNGSLFEGAIYVYLGSATGTMTGGLLFESNQANAEFGSSVSGAGDLNGDGYSDVIAGAPKYDNSFSDQGRSWVFYGSAAGTSTSSPTILQSFGGAAYFGQSVSDAGDVNGDGYDDVIVGAPVIERAAVYYGAAAGLQTSPAWSAVSAQDGDQTGGSVSTAGDVNGDGYADVIVGSSNYTNGEAGEGIANVYLGSASGLSTSAIWSVEGSVAIASFGSGVSNAGDVNGDGYSDIIVGAYSYSSNKGRAFVYLGNSTGVTLTSAWTVEDSVANGIFGASVAAAGDVNGDGFSDFIVGSPDYANGQTFEGAAFLYHGGTTTFVSATRSSSVYGGAQNVDLGGNTNPAGDVNGDGYSDVIVGTVDFNPPVTYVYHGSASGIGPSSVWNVAGGSSASAGDVNGDGYSDVIVATNATTSTKIFLGSSTGLAVSASWTLSFAASSVASAGDVNGDGYSDVIVGRSGSNQAYIYYGSATTMSTTASTTLTGTASTLFGKSVSSAGDVNGDGFSDVIVGAPTANNAFVYLGSANGVSTTPQWTGTGAGEYGGTVGTAGDVNGDGYSEITVGASQFDNGHTNEGAGYVYYGSSTGTVSTGAWSNEGNQNNAQYGHRISTAGDVNGDGYADIIVAAKEYSNTQFAEGGIFVYLGSGTGLSPTPVITAGGGVAGAILGTGASTAGDVNGDGFSDVVAGAPNWINTQSNEGAAFVYYGAGGGTRTRPRMLRSNLTTPIVSLGRTHSTSDAGASLYGKSFVGRTKVKIQIETKLLGTAFDGTGLTESTTWTTTGSDVTQAISGLSSSDRYKVRMRLKYSPINNFQTCSRWYYVQGNSGLTETDFLVSNVDNATEPSTQASNLTFSNIAATSLTLNWTSGNGTSRIVVARATSAVDALPIDGKVYAAAAFGSGSQISSGQYVVYKGTGNSASITGLSANTTYSFRVYEFSGSGNLENYVGVSAINNPRSQITTPVAPTLNSPTSITQTSFSLSWSAVTGATNYTLDVSADNFSTFVSQNESLGNVTTKSVTGLTAGTTYSVRLRAVNSGGSSAYSGTQTALTIPANPTMTAATNIGQTSASLNWNAVTGAVDYFLDLSSDNFANLVAGYPKSSLTGTSFSATGLLAGTTYQARLRSRNATGTSSNSSTVSFTTLAAEPLIQPTSLTFTALTTSSMTANFNIAAGSPTGYLVLMKAGSSPTDVPVDGTQYTAGGTIGTSTIAYVGPLTSFSPNGLTTNTVYHFDVFAYNGTTGTFNYLTTTPLENSQSTLAVEPTAQPTIISFTNVAQSSMKVSFTAATGSPSGYIAMRKTGSAPTDVPVDGTSYTAGTTVGTSSVAYVGSAATFDDSGLSGSTTYHYAIYSFNGSGGASNYNTVSPLTGNQLTASSSLPLQINTAAASTTVVNGFGSVDLTANVSNGTGSKTVTMYYRKITADAFQEANVPFVSGNDYKVTVTESMLDELGMEYYFEAEDASTTVTQSTHSFLYRSITQSTANSSIPFLNSFNGKASSYQMFSVPYVLDDRAFQSIFDELGTYDKSVWRLFRYDGASETYKEFGAGLPVNIELGKAYWFNTAKNLVEPILVGAGDVSKSSQATPFNGLTVVAGWNQIGNPYTFNIDWETIQDANLSIGLNSLWVFESGSYEKKTVLESWKGAFVWADNPGTVTFPVMSRTTSGGRVHSSNLSNDIDATDWQVSFSLAHQYMNLTSAIGMHSSASESKDKFDEITVPRFVDYLEMKTDHPEYRAQTFSADIVPTAPAKTWEFTLTSNLGDGPAILSWDNQSLRNSESQIVLIDATEQVWIDMKQQNSYSFAWKENRKISVVYARSGEIDPGSPCLGMHIQIRLTATSQFLFW